MKKRFVGILTLCIISICFALLSTNVSAATSGTCGDNLTWSLDDDGTLTISGTGDMAEYSQHYESEYAPWLAHKDYIKTVEIADGVTSIGNAAFYDCTYLDNTTIPKSVISIGEYAFYNTSHKPNEDGIVYIDDCLVSGSYLNDSYEIKAGTRLISDRAFYGEYSYGTLGTANIIIPDSVEIIGEEAFALSELKSITIGTNVTTIGEGAFRYCELLEEVVWNAKNVSDFEYMHGVFDDSGHQSTGINVVFGNNVERVPAYTFYTEYKTNITSVVISNAVETIGESAFLNCESLKKVNMGNSVKTIENSVFENCVNLKDITLSDSLINIGDYAFKNCISFENIIIPDSVKTIGYSSFKGCDKVMNITIGINTEDVSQEAFSDCMRLEKIFWNAKNANCGNPYNSESSFDRSGKNGNGISVIFGNTVENIPDNLFNAPSYSEYDDTYKPKITNVITGDGVKTIGESAFSGCIYLKSLTIGNNVTDIGGGAFNDCTNLLTINWNAKNVNDFDFENLFTNAGREGAGVIAIFGDNVEHIPACTFLSNNFNNITSVIIGHSVKTIGESAFSNCKNLRSVDIGDNVTSIAASAFEDCTSLDSITIPQNVTYIGHAAFYNCNLSRVYFDGNAPELGGGFSYNSPTFYIPRNSTGWTIPEWNGYHTVWYDDLSDLPIGAAGSQLYIPTGNSSGVGENKVKRTKIKFHTDLAAEEDRDLTMEIPWGWELFDKPATTYDNRLATAALALSSAIYQGSFYESASDFQNLLNTFGFSQITSVDYDNLESKVSHSISHKKVDFNGEECDIFAIVCRGTQNLFDWTTNIDLNGFYIAADDVWNRLQQSMLTYYGVSDLELLKDKNIKFFITGHSLGAAVANLMPWKMENFASDENVFVYTFATPRTWDTQWSKSNVHNIINVEDTIPNLPPIRQHRIGTDHYFYRENYNMMDPAFIGLVNGVTGKVPGLNYVMTVKPSEILNVVTGTFIFNQWNRNITYAHDTTTYMAYLLSNEYANELYTYAIRKTSILCPVDVEVYNEAGELVGKIKDNKVDETVPSDVIFFIDGDKKYVYMPYNGEYTFVLTGNDIGEMDYTVETIDASTGKITETKTFSSVALTNGKAMTSEAGNDIPAQNVQLFVVDNNAPTAEVAETGAESEIIGQIPVTAITGVERIIQKGNSTTLNGVVHPSYAEKKEIVWTIADAGTTEATLTDNVLSAPKSGVLTLTATVVNGIAEGEDFVQDIEITVIEPPALYAPSLLKWEGTIATWNLIYNACGYSVQLYKNDEAFGDAVLTNELTYDFKDIIENDKMANYTYTVKSVGDDVNYSSSQESEVSPIYSVNWVIFQSVLDGIATVQVNMDETCESAEIFVARYDNGRLTELHSETIEASKTVIADLSSGTGTTYKAFLWKGMSSLMPLCSPALY